MADILKGCEFVVVTNTDHTKRIVQKCATCDNKIGYYSKSGKQERRKNTKCLPCVQEKLNEACKNDKSHMQRLSEN